MYFASKNESVTNQCALSWQAQWRDWSGCQSCEPQDVLNSHWSHLHKNLGHASHFLLPGSFHQVTNGGPVSWRGVIHRHIKSPAPNQRMLASQIHTWYQCYSIRWCFCGQVPTSALSGGVLRQCIKMRLPTHTNNTNTYISTKPTSQSPS